MQGVIQCVLEQTRQLHFTCLDIPSQLFYQKQINIFIKPCTCIHAWSLKTSSGSVLPSLTPCPLQWLLLRGCVLSVGRVVTSAVSTVQSANTSSLPQPREGHDQTLTWRTLQTYCRYYRKRYNSFIYCHMSVIWLSLTLYTLFVYYER